MQEGKYSKSFYKGKIVRFDSLPVHKLMPGKDMKLKQFVENLTKLMQERPETAEFKVVTSKDDEGNGYSLVYYGPFVGHYDSDEKEFYQEKELNAVCVN